MLYPTQKPPGGGASNTSKYGLQLHRMSEFKFRDKWETCYLSFQAEISDSTFSFKRSKKNLRKINILIIFKLEIRVIFNIIIDQLYYFVSFHPDENLEN